MNGLVVAAHGNGQGSAANQLIQRQAQRAAQRLGIEHFTAAFHKGSPSFRESLDLLPSSEIVVVPFMAASGYYSQSVLPRELVQSPSWTTKRIHVSRPVGCSEALTAMVLSGVRTALQNSHIPVAESGLMVIGHGTFRHSQSRASTETLAQRLREEFSVRSVEAAFLDEAPGPRTVAQAWRSRGITQGLVVPFLMAPGTHSEVDIPRLLGDFEGLTLTRPIGAWDEIPKIVAETALEVVSS